MADLDESVRKYFAVLLLGPLYHLVERVDRLRALGEARRVLRPGGVVLAAGISRYAGLLELLVAERLHEPEVRPLVAAAIGSGAFMGTADGLFTTAYFHLPRELRAEVEEAGFISVEVLSIEGPGFVAHDFERRWADPAQRDTMLWAAEVVEAEPERLAASSHLLAVGSVGEFEWQTEPRDGKEARPSPPPPLQDRAEADGPVDTLAVHTAEEGRRCARWSW